ncbi:MULTISPECIES: MBL fold metallo-hydrolase [Bizionia]|uniref:MBL fold metallo-hydrolase n=1 Tax=Bizionia algoritergicola TaxID=291187 RepID=A0A5D0QZ25_9FLAO|nr:MULTISPECIES: MBL fold metallo-hydrolase [Bizionia]OBX18410.1 MBL fold metallo-hydrolase [Bizionia sp. APA-3]TYB73484.1 MBL fold metallo-hydrolase [Bizionia algoritergicola]
MKTKYISIFIISILFIGCKSDKEQSEPILNETDIETEIVVEVPSEIDIPNYYVASDIKITPVEHASMVINFNDISIYVDPVGEAIRYAGFKSPTFIIITDIHGDHLDVKTLEAINTTNSIIIGPQAVKDKLPESLKTNFTVLENGQEKDDFMNKTSMNIEAIPMYNLREEALKFHPKGRGNGYVLTINNKRIYISGDTEDIPEMRNLKNIDIALVCMNLPYTMPIESAADAVLAFQPKTVLPYHYRGTKGFSHVESFKKRINDRNKSIEVIQLDWYK